MEQERKPDFKRLRNVLLREAMPDAVPFYDLFADVEVVCHATRKPYGDEAVIEFFYKMGYDYVPAWIAADYGEKKLLTADASQLFTKSERRFTDEYHGVIENRADFEAYAWPDEKVWRIGSVNNMSRDLPDGMKLIVSLRGVFESAMYLMSLVPLSLAIHEDEQLVMDVFENVGLTHLRMMRTCLETSDISKIGAVTICEDMGYVQGTFLSPDSMREYAFPWMKQCVELVHAYDLPAIMHACGNLAEVMDDLIDDVGFDARQSFEDKILPVTEAKAKYGDRIALLGGIDIHVLSSSSEAQVREYVRNVLRICTAGGGYALGTGNSVPNYIPYENYLAMLDEGRRFVL